MHLEMGDARECSPEDLDKDLQDNHIDKNGGKIPFKKKRTEVRKAASYDKDLGVRVSLQICPVTEMRTRLNGMLQLMKCSQTKSCTTNGMMNVLDELMVTSIEVFSSIRVNFPIKGLIDSLQHINFTAVHSLIHQMRIISKMSYCHMTLGSLSFYFHGMGKYMLY